MPIICFEAPILAVIANAFFIVVLKPESQYNNGLSYFLPFLYFKNCTKASAHLWSVLLKAKEFRHFLSETVILATVLYTFAP